MLGKGLIKHQHFLLLERRHRVGNDLFGIRQKCAQELAHPIHSRLLLGGLCSNMGVDGGQTCSVFVIQRLPIIAPMSAMVNVPSAK